MKSDKKTNLVWIDLEMTGLDLDKNRIIQIACLITNENLEVIAEGPEILIRQPAKYFDKNNLFIVENFIQTGFADRVEKAKHDETQAEKKVLTFIKKHVEEGLSPLCGNSIYMDRMFINRYMKKLNLYLHHRLVDVSTVKHLALTWYPELPKYEKKDMHRAMDAIKESIEELKYYRKHLFK